MIVGYILIGVMAGLVAFVAALVSGASIWSALALYSLVGSVGVITVPLVRLAFGTLEPESEASPKEGVFDAEVASPSSTPPSDDVDLERQDSPEPGIDTSDELAFPLRILAVDDDPFILELIPMIAATAGYSDVTPVASGKLALEALTNTENIFKCLLFDINMPEIDGIELCALVRQIPAYRDTPIIMLTAMRDMKYMDRAFKAGATDYATKPFDIADLTDRLRFAEEAIIARQRSAAAAKTAGESAEIAPHNPVALSETDRLKGVGSLADYTAVGNYLTQLTRDQMRDTQVVAIKVDHIESIYATATADMFARILRDVAGVVESTLDSRLMTYAGNGVFLSISDTVKLNPSLIEENVCDRLASMTFTNRNNDLFQISVSIGDPVTPIETKTKRAMITFGRAITRAENRFHQKQGELMSENRQQGSL